MKLQREVEDLGRTLEHEENIQRLLRGALRRSPGDQANLLQLPSSLPEKAKVLLAELVMVESEIVRLQEEISDLQRSSQTPGPGEDKQVGGGLNKSEPTLVPSNQDTLQKKDEQGNREIQTRSMFFINQEPKIDHALQALICSKGANGGPQSGRTAVKDDRKDRHDLGVLDVSFSPKVTARSSLSRTPEREAGASPSLLRDRMPFRPRSSQNNGKKPQPNKLSERIMKCLICVFLRMVRTSRKPDRDKPSAGSRLVHAPSGVGNDGTDLRLAETRVTKQQDPYGVFRIDGTRERDIGRYKNLVICTPESLDARAMSNCAPLIGRLRVLLNGLRDLELRTLTHKEKLAFWINMHNAAIMNGYLEHGLPSDPEEVFELRNKAWLNVGGNELNALAIEHFLLRPARSEDVSRTDGSCRRGLEDVRDAYGFLDGQEPNVAFALCCGNKSSPAVRIYTAENVSAELEKAKVEYLQASMAVCAAADRKLVMPALLHRHMNDFAEDLDSLVRWICNQLPTSGSLRKSMVACLNGSGACCASKMVDILPYEFDFQFLLPKT